MTDRHGPPPGDGGSEDSRAEQVLSQALRVMAGDGKPPGGVPSIPPTAQRANRRRLTTGQLILLAAIVGLLIGICAGFISLMV